MHTTRTHRPPSVGRLSKPLWVILYLCFPSKRPKSPYPLSSIRNKEDRKEHNSWHGCERDRGKVKRLDFLISFEISLHSHFLCLFLQTTVSSLFANSKMTKDTWTSHKSQFIHQLYKLNETKHLDLLRLIKYFHSFHTITIIFSCILLVEN